METENLDNNYVVLGIGVDGMELNRVNNDSMWGQENLDVWDDLEVDTELDKYIYQAGGCKICDAGLPTGQYSCQIFYRQ